MTRPAVVLMAAGRGARLRPITDQIPKPLVPVLDVTLIERLMAQVAPLRPSSVTVCVGYRAGQVRAAATTYARRYGLPLRVVRQTGLDGPFDALRLALDTVDSSVPVLAANADLWMNWNPHQLLADLRESPGGLAVAGVRVPDAAQLGELVLDGPQVTGMREKAGIQRPAMVNAGVHALTPDIAEMLYHSDPGHIDNADVLVHRLAERGAPAVLSRAVSHWNDVGDPESVLRVNLEQAGAASWVSDSAEVHPGAELSRTVIGEGSRVEASSRLEECIVLPGTQVPPHLEARRAVVLEHEERTQVIPAHPSEGLDATDTGTRR